MKPQAKASRRIRNVKLRRFAEAIISPKKEAKRVCHVLVAKEPERCFSAFQI
jgi:hypothetical protein